MSAKMLRFFEDYFDITYPLIHQNIVALPDFPGKLTHLIAKWINNGMFTF